MMNHSLYLSNRRSLYLGSRYILVTYYICIHKVTNISLLIKFYFQFSSMSYLPFTHLIPKLNQNTEINTDEIQIIVINLEQHEMFIIFNCIITDKLNNWAIYLFTVILVYYCEEISLQKENIQRLIKKQTQTHSKQSKPLTLRGSYVNACSLFGSPIIVRSRFLKICFLSSVMQLRLLR